MSNLNCLPRALPRDAYALANWVTKHLGSAVPVRAVCPHHSAPADYLWHALTQPTDAVVWACRGGGKTYFAAMACVLEQFFGLRTESAVLGGSPRQSTRVLGYARKFAEDLGILVDSTARSVVLQTGVIHAFPQSEKAVRGMHVERLRCDEVELFDEDVFSALSFSTTGRTAAGTVECLSTAHRMGGRMMQLIKRCRESGPASPNDHASANDNGAEAWHPAITPFTAVRGSAPRLFSWCLWDVIERCPPERQCGDCPLHTHCQGKAREAAGFFRIDDAINIIARASRPSWEAEMLCLGPRVENLVFPAFDLSRNVAPVTFDARLPLYRCIDFGFTGMFVVLWFQVDALGTVRVIQEYARNRLPLEFHAREILKLDPRRDDGEPARVAATFVDPAGNAANLATGISTTSQLAGYGIVCQARATSIESGLELIRSKLQPAVGGTSLFIHPQCRGLIDAFGAYRLRSPGEAEALKEGPDHWIDALRYGLTGSHRYPTQTRRYG